MLPPWLESVRKDLERVLPPVQLQYSYSTVTVQLPHKKEKGQEQVLSEKQHSVHYKYYKMITGLGSVPRRNWKRRNGSHFALPWIKR
jgi:hypothetical protein